MHVCLHMCDHVRACAPVSCVYVCRPKPKSSSRTDALYMEADLRRARREQRVSVYASGMYTPRHTTPHHTPYVFQIVHLYDVFGCCSVPAV